MPTSPTSATHGRARARRGRRLVAFSSALVAIWLAAAYLVLPSLWRHHEHQPGLADKPMLTRTTQGIPGDPINVGLVGSKEEIIRAMDTAGWQPADAVTFKSSFKIGASVALDHPYPAAPISTLDYAGKPQALAFEKIAGKSAKTRNHVRFWLSLETGKEGRPVWLGAASFDRGVGFSHYTGQITHHVGPDLDAERDLLIGDLSRAAMLKTIYRVTGIGPTAAGRNGGGDPYFTDGDISVGVLTPGDTIAMSEPTTLQDATPIVIKNKIWSSVSSVARSLDLMPKNDIAAKNVTGPGVQPAKNR